jgi:hypothetical protein
MSRSVHTPIAFSWFTKEQTKKEPGCARSREQKGAGSEGSLSAMYAGSADNLDCNANEPVNTAIEQNEPGYP